MKKLFLAASFADVAQHFPQFIGTALQGKTVTFIPTASKVEDITFYVDDDKQAFEKLGIIVDELDISKHTTEQIQQKLQQNDYIFISGGNTFYLLQELKKSGADQLIIAQIEQGKPYIGTSAGSIILAPNIEYIAEMDDQHKAPDLTDFSALNVIDFFPLPHYGDEPFADIAKNILHTYQHLQNVVPISNDQHIEIIA